MSDFVSSFEPFAKKCSIFKINDHGKFFMAIRNANVTVEITRQIPKLHIHIPIAVNILRDNLFHKIKWQILVSV